MKVTKKELKQKGNKLAWAIVHLILFVWMLFSDNGTEDDSVAFFILLLTIFVGSRFIANVEEFFEKC